MPRELVMLVELRVFQKDIEGRRGRIDESRPTIQEIAFEDIAADEKQGRVEDHDQRDSPALPLDLVRDQARRVGVDLATFAWMSVSPK